MPIGPLPVVRVIALERKAIASIGFPNITPQLAREADFLGVFDPLKGAKHG
jgi:hypothetical protein